MKISPLPAGWAVLPLALGAAFSALAQTVTVASAQLPDVVVVGSGFSQSATSLPFGVSVVTAQDIAASGASTVNEALMRVLGIYGRLDTSGGNNYGLDLRGFGATSDSNQVVIVDDLRLNEADMGLANLAAIPVESVARIEVLRGSGAVVYGEGATGGVILVTTKAGLAGATANGGSFYQALASYGGTDTRATATLVAGHFSLDASANVNHSDGFRDNFSTTNQAQAATVQWADGDLRLGARLGQSAQESGLPGALTAEQYAANPHTSMKPNDYGTTTAGNGGVFAQWDVLGWQWSADVNRRAKSLASAYYYDGYFYGYDVDAYNTAVRARREHALWGQKNDLTVGYQADHWTRTMAPVSGSDVATSNAVAFFVKDDLTLTASDTRLSLGLRTESLDKSESSSQTTSDGRMQAWELGLSQALSTAWTAYGRLGQSYRLPNVDEFSYTEPNTLLQPQTSHDSEVGARWKRQGTQLDMRLYYSALSNEIGFDPNATGPWGPGGANVNFAATVHQGVELEWRQAVSATLDTRVNAAVRQATFVAGPYSGNALVLVPTQTLALRANWRPAAGHSLNGGLNWVSAQNPDFANACQIPSYTVADARYAYQMGRFEWALGVSNLMDQTYYTQAYACTDNVTNGIYPEPGRIVQASFKVQF